MKRFLLPLLFAASCFGLTVSNINFSNVSHGSLFLTFNTDSSINLVRLRFAVSPATCTSGTGGTVFMPAVDYSQTNPYNFAVSGLVAGTTYQMCPEVSSDGGSTWTSGVGASVTMLPLPAVHPAPPIAPATFSYSYPDTTAGTCADTGQPGYCSVMVSSSCSDFMSDVFHAISIQASSGTVINIPAGTVCSGTGNGVKGNYNINQNPPDVKTFNAGSVNSSTINIPNHGYTEGQKIVFAGNYSCIAGCSGPNAAIKNGAPYYAHVVDANNFQVYSGPPGQGGTQISLSPGGNNIYVAGLPRKLYWVIIRTATPDSQFVPAGTRTSPAWDSKIPFFSAPLSNLGQPDAHYNLFTFNDPDGNDTTLVSNIYLMGIGFTRAPNPYAGTSSDPLYGGYLYVTGSVNENIVCDRCRFKGNGAPANGVRNLNVIGWDGMNVAFTNSYFDGMHYFHGASTGLKLSGTSPTSFVITSGTAHFGAGSGTLANTASVAFNGTSTGQHEVFSYFDFSGRLNVILPPGLYAGASGTNLNGACSGVSNCIVKAASSTGGGRYCFSSTMCLPANSLADDYLAEPIYSNSSSCGSTQTLTGNATPQYSAIRNDGPTNVGTAFYSDSAGYICGMRFLFGGTVTGRQVALYQDGNPTALATATSPENAGVGTWQVVNFASPVPITAGTVYIVAYQAGTANWYFRSNGYQNWGDDNAPLHVYPHYADGNQACNYTDAWPWDGQGRPAAGEVACVYLTNGGISGGVNGDVTTSQFFPEGCQCMLGGVGPGPWAMVNNYVEGSGNMWHHDSGGAKWSDRGDYTYYRNTFTNPLWTMWGTSSTNPSSDGNVYLTRQVNEWKGGKRIQIYGSIYDTSYNSVSPASLAIAFASGSSGASTITDVDVQYNTFRHIAGAFDISDYGSMLPEARYRFANNLFWDVNGWKYHDLCVQNNCSFAGSGWIFEGPGSMEDLIIDHNTIVGNDGSNPALFWLFSGHTEGLQFTNNFAYINGSNEGAAQEGGDIPNDSCTGLRGQALMDCKFTPNYLFTNNVLIGNGVTQAQLQSWYPSSHNYIPGNMALSGIGWFNCPGSLCASGTPDFHLKANYCSGCGNRGTDLHGIGADIDALESAQGKVTLVGTSGITSSSAKITFDAPDAASCPVDFSSSDPTLINSFTRKNDPGTGKVRTITLSGLSSGTVYHYRVNCAVQQPTGEFRTN